MKLQSCLFLCHADLVVRLENPVDSPESAQSADVCVSVLSGVLQVGVGATVTVNIIPNDPEGKNHCLCVLFCP